MSINLSDEDIKLPLTSDLIRDQDIQNISKEEKENYYQAGFLSKLFFNWTTYAIGKANKKTLKVNDLTGLEFQDQARSLVRPLFNNWYGDLTKPQNERKGYYSDKNNSLFFCVFVTNLWYIGFLTILNLLASLMKYSQIFFFRELILHFKQYHIPNGDAKPFFPLYVTTTAFILLKIGKTFMHHQSGFLQQILGVKTVNQVSALIYDKLMKTSVFIKNQISEGEILNFIQVDANTLEFLYASLPKIFNAPFNLIVSLYMLFVFFGKSFIFGFVTLAFLLGLILYIQSRFLYHTTGMMTKKDARMRVTTHTFHILKMLKLFGWEDEFEKKITMKRNEELVHVSIILNLIAFRSFINSNISLLISIASIAGYTYINGSMKIEDLFASLELIEEIAVPLIHIPQFITELIVTTISLNRIQKFLNVKDIETSSHEQISQNEVSIHFKNCSFGVKKGQDKTPQNIILDNISLDIKKGEFVGIVGETGSGKSCLINTILNNLEYIPSKESEIVINGQASYAGQEPWIMNDTIRNNILFYNKYNQARYEKVVNVCQLTKDLDTFPHSDLTEVGSTGTNLSGGQRARISLARALYNDVDMYLLDDPISNVDSLVSMEIFNQAFKDFLKFKTRIFVTHDTRNLSLMDKIVYVEKNQIKWVGTYNELIQQEFFKIISAIFEKKPKEEQAIVEVENKKLPDVHKVGKLIKDEDQKEGSVIWNVYQKYFKIQGGYLLFAFLLLLIIGYTGAKYYGNIYISNWTNKAEKEPNSHDSNLYHFFVYAQISFLGVLLQFIKEFAIARSNAGGGKKLHEQMIECLIRAPINLFYDITPIGQLLNRLTHDLDMTGTIIWTFDTIGNSYIGLLSAIYVCYYYNPSTLFVAPVLFVIGLFFTKYVINSGRDLNRLDSVSRSPAVNLVSETILGITTIRTSKNEGNLKEEFYERLDKHFSVMRYKYGADNWFCMFLDLLSHGYLGFIIIYACYRMDLFTAEVIALMLKYSSEFSEKLLESLEQSTKVEKAIISFERCETFIQILSEKRSKMKDEEKHLMNWPSKGEVKFDNYSMRYRPNTEIVLKNINIDIIGGSKIGIVGRTGSGKSSLCLGLFRVIEPLKGHIYIDGVDISTISLKKLRQSISIVPQDPFLLEGTLKENLDPLDNYKEKEILDVLKKLELFKLMTQSNKINDGINTKIKEYGNNLSFGERQLVCFARAILRKSKVIILDEATSSVDQKTEEVIQNAVNSEFKNSTVITIAHRLKTIKQCDKIIVIDNGEILEYDTPNNLIKNIDSKFYKLYYQNNELSD